MVNTLKSLLLIFAFCLIQNWGIAQNAVCGYTYSKAITIQAGRVAGGPHSNFPLLISHTDTNLRTTGNGGHVANSNGYDIMFADSNGVALEFQLEHYVATSGQIVAWVRIPSLGNASNTTIYMLYGKAGIVSNQSSTGVWSGYHGVWHLNNNDLDDATSNAYDGTNNGSSNLATAQIAGGRTFVDPNHWIELSTFPNMSGSFTLSAWVRTVDNTETGQRVFCDDRFNSDGGYALSVGDGGTGMLRFYVRGLSNVILDSPVNTINNNTWYHCVAVLDRNTNNKYLYVNGTQVASQTATGTLSTDAGNASIGGEVVGGETGNRFDGNLDEVRSFNGVLSANRILSEYRNQSLPTSFPGTNANDFYAVGSEDLVMHSSTASGDWDDTGIWSSGAVPNGIFDNVVINHDVNIDGGSGNYTVCDCSILSTGAQNAYLDVTSTRILTLLGDLNMTFSGAGINNTRLELSGSATLNIAGNLHANRTNTDAAADLTISIMDNATLNIDSSMNLLQSAGDDLRMNLEDNASLNVLGDMNASLSGGDVLGFNFDDNAVVDCSGDVNISHSGGNDMDLYINNTSGTNGHWLVGGDFNITHTGGDDIEIFIDDSGSELSITGSFNGTFTGATDGERLNVNMDAGTFSSGNMVLSRGSNFGELFFDIDGGTFNCSNLSIGSSGTLFSNGQVRIEIDESVVFSIDSSAVINMTGGDDFSIWINNNAGTQGQFLVGGDFTVTRSSGDDFTIHADDDNSLFSIGGDFTFNSSGGEQFTIDLDEDAVFSVGGDFAISHSQGQSGTINLEHNTNLSNPHFDVGGDFNLVLSGGADSYSILQNGGSMDVGGSMNLTCSSGGSTEDISVLLENDAVMNISDDLALLLSGGDDLQFQIGANTTGSTAILNVGGNCHADHNGSTGGDDLLVLFHDDAAVSIQGNLIIDSDFTGDDILVVRLNNTASIDIDGNVQFIAVAEGKSELELNNDSELLIAGNFQRAAAPNDFGILDCNTNASIVFNGSTSQIFPRDEGGGSDEFDFRFVTINNSRTTAPQLTMEGLATVHAGITFIDGIISSTTANKLVIDNGASTAGASNASHVDGVVAKVGNTPAGAYTSPGYAFPVGDLGVYRPIYISAPANTTDMFQAQYFHVNPDDASYDTTALGISIYHVSTLEYWILDRLGTSAVSVRLSWNATSLVGNMASLLVARWNGSQWTDAGNGGTTGTISAGTVVSNGTISAFSPFTLGSTGNANPLPITLLTFNGEHQGGHNVLRWTTATEINNDFFTLERGRDNEHFELIGTIAGAGNSSDPRHYQFTDLHPYPGLNHYRLGQTDYDGSTKYAGVIEVMTPLSASNGIALSPNPVNDVLTIRAAEALNGTIRLSNAAGQLILERMVQSATHLTLDLRSLAPGLYYFQFISPGSTQIQKLIVE